MPDPDAAPDPLLDDEFLVDMILNPGETQDTFAGEYDLAGRRVAVGPLRARAVRTGEPAQRRLRRLQREESAIAVLERLPDPGEEIAMIMDGTFHGFDLLGASLRLAAPAECTAAHLSTMSINKTHVQHILALGQTDAQGDRPWLRDLTLLVSEVFAQKDPDVWEFIAREFAAHQPPWRFHANRNHTKLIALAFDTAPPLLIHGSLNLRRCHAYEQVHFSRDPALYAFYVDFIEDALTTR